MWICTSEESVVDTSASGYWLLHNSSRQQTPSQWSQQDSLSHVNCPYSRARTKVQNSGWFVIGNKARAVYLPVTSNVEELVIYVHAIFLLL